MLAFYFDIYKFSIAVSSPPSRKGSPTAGREDEVLDGPFDGGMGRVYKVKHLKWGIELAAKCPLPQFWENKVLMKRFEREVEAWTEMGRHPNIVNAYYTNCL